MWQGYAVSLCGKVNLPLLLNRFVGLAECKKGNLPLLLNRFVDFTKDKKVNLPLFCEKKALNTYSMTYKGLCV
jgi:hypothetical protein